MWFCGLKDKKEQNVFVRYVQRLDDQCCILKQVKASMP